MPIELPAAVEKAAQRIAAQLVAQQAVVIQTPIADEGHSAPVESVATLESVEAAPVDLQAVDVDSLELTRPRTVDYESLPLMTMYRAADALWKHSTRIEQTLFMRITDLFGFSTTITLYDLSNASTKAKCRTIRKPVMAAQKKPVLSKAEGNARIVRW